MSSLVSEYSNKILDIEELNSHGKLGGFCPFFLTKNLAEVADIVFMPYNYALDAQKRTNFGDLFKDAIMIFDEAHNVEGHAEEGESDSITTQSLWGVIDEFKRLKKIMSDISLGMGTRFKNKQEALIEEVSQEEARKFLRDFEELQNPIISLYRGLIDLKKSYEQKNKGSGGYRFGNRDTRYEDKMGELKTIDELIRLIFACSKGEKSNATYYFTGGPTASQFQNGLNQENLKKFNQKLSSIVSAFHNSAHGLSFDVERLMNFTVRIEEIIDSERGKPTDLPWMRKTSNHFKANISYDKISNDLELNIWCMIPAIAFDKILKMDVYNLFFTSGTMEPLDGFEDLIGIKCGEKLTNPHTIDSEKQLLTRIAMHYSGENGARKPFNFSFSNRGDDSLYVNLGKLVVKSCKNTPNGVLVFFTSYAVLAKTFQVWSNFQEKGDSILDLLSKEKVICKEDRDKETFQENLQLFLGNYDRKGAIFLGVFGGKLSEGIDFTDKMARLVFLVGIPYANKSDMRLQAKEMYLNERSRNSPPGSGAISWNTWYFNNAMRLMNQTAGRVIRHLNDFGAIVFVDERYMEKSTFRSMSGWIQKSLLSSLEKSNFEEDFQVFFAERKREEEARLISTQVLSNQMSSNSNQAKAQVQRGLSNQAKEAFGNLFIPSQPKQKKASNILSAPNSSSIDFHKLIENSSSRIENNLLLSTQPPQAENSIERMVSQSKQHPLTQPSRLSFPEESNPYERALAYVNAMSKIDSPQLVFPPNYSKRNQMESQSELGFEQMASGSQNKVRILSNQRDSSPQTSIRTFELSQAADEMPIDNEEDRKEKARREEGRAGAKDGKKTLMECTVCFESLNKVFLTARCGHILCKECWDQLFKAEKKPGCPYCKKAVIKNHLIKLFAS